MSFYFVRQDPLLMRHGSQPTAHRPPHLVASYDTQGVLRTYFNPDVPTRILIFCHSSYT